MSRVHDRFVLFLFCPGFIISRRNYLFLLLLIVCCF